jgi:starch-binding outer membrane protein, SusD/RagB family
MKQKINVFCKITGLIAAMLLSSCNIQYDPIDVPVAATYWKTESDANAAILGAYSKLREVLQFGGDAYFRYGDYPSQMFTTESWAAGRATVGDYQWDGKAGNTDWSPFYKPLLAANLSIKRIAEMPTTAFSGGEVGRKSYIGEALFLRAYTYFYMTRIWGTVPMLLNPVEDASEAVMDFPLSTENQLLTQCIVDLKRADSCLTWQATAGKPAIRANRASVNALLAHVYMWRTRANKTTIDKNDFEQALNCINNIEQNSGAALVSGDNLHAIWNGQSIESLFEFPFKAADGEGFRQYEGIADHFMEYPYITNRKNMDSRYQFSQEFRDLYHEKSMDQRVIQLFENFDDPKHNFTTKYNNIQYTNADKTAWVTSGTVVVFRLADMYLLKAEALIKKETPDLATARIYLNKIRNRAGLADYTGADASLYSEVSDERSRELFLEGHRLYDWVRTGFYVSKSTGGIYTQDRYLKEGYLLPVNFSLISGNVYVHQTPYWQDKLSFN